LTFKSLMPMSLLQIEKEFAMLFSGCEDNFADTFPFLAPKMLRFAKETKPAILYNLPDVDDGRLPNSGVKFCV